MDHRYFSEGQIWVFDRRSGLNGDCKIVSVDGYGSITGEYYDHIGTRRVERVRAEDLAYLKEE